MRERKEQQTSAVYRKSEDVLANMKSVGSSSQKNKTSAKVISWAAFYAYITICTGKVETRCGSSSGPAECSKYIVKKIKK